MKDIIIACLALIITTLFIVGIAYGFTLVSKEQVIAPDATAKAQIGETNFDWGQINYNDGKVNKTFTIKNGGEGILKLYRGTTSCACTTAQIRTKTDNSPLFGMHIPMQTVFEVRPGEEAQLEMVFDPAYHGPGGIGPISRTATLLTNDSKLPILVFTARGNVVR